MRCFDRRNDRFIVMIYWCHYILCTALVGGVTLGLLNPSLGCLADKFYLSKFSTCAIFIVSGNNFNICTLLALSIKLCWLASQSVRIDFAKRRNWCGFRSMACGNFWPCRTPVFFQRSMHFVGSVWMFLSVQVENEWTLFPLFIVLSMVQLIFLWYFTGFCESAPCWYMFLTIITLFVQSSILLFTPYFSKIIIQIQLQPQEFITGLLKIPLLFMTHIFRFMYLDSIVCTSSMCVIHYSSFNPFFAKLDQFGYSVLYSCRYTYLRYII